MISDIGEIQKNLQQVYSGSCNNLLQIAIELVLFQDYAILKAEIFVMSVDCSAKGNSNLIYKMVQKFKKTQKANSKKFNELKETSNFLWVP